MPSHHYIWWSPKKVRHYQTVIKSFQTPLGGSWRSPEPKVGARESGYHHPHMSAPHRFPRHTGRSDRLLALAGPPLMCTCVGAWVVWLIPSRQPGSFSMSSRHLNARIHSPCVASLSSVTLQLSGCRSSTYIGRKPDWTMRRLLPSFAASLFSAATSSSAEKPEVSERCSCPFSAPESSLWMNWNVDSSEFRASFSSSLITNAYNYSKVAGVDVSKIGGVSLSLLFPFPYNVLSLSSLSFPLSTLPPLSSFLFLQSLSLHLFASPFLKPPHTYISCLMQYQIPFDRCRLPYCTLAISLAEWRIKSAINSICTQPIYCAYILFSGTMSNDRKAIFKSRNRYWIVDSIWILVF